MRTMLQPSQTVNSLMSGNRANIQPEPAKVESVGYGNLSRLRLARASTAEVVVVLVVVVAVVLVAVVVVVVIVVIVVVVVVSRTCDGVAGHNLDRLLRVRDEPIGGRLVCTALIQNSASI